MSWLFEEERTDYLGIMTGALGTAVNFAIDLPMVVFAFLCSCGLISYEFVAGYAIIVSELLGLQEWWGTEHTVLFIWMLVCLPAFCKRSTGNCQEIFRQVICGLSGLMVFGCFLQLANGVQGGDVFNGKLAKPTMAVLAVVVMMFGSNIDGIKKEIYGYGVSDVPADEKCAKVFNSIKKFIGLETVIFLTMATFGLPPFDLNAEDQTPWLCAFPIIGMVRAMNTYFAPEVDEKAADVAADVNGTPPKAQEGKKVEAVAPEKEKVNVKEEIKAIEKNKEGEEKTEAGPEKVAMVSKICGKVKNVVACATNLILSAIEKAKSLIDCIVGRVLSLPWNCILDTIICLGTKATYAYCFWYLTSDYAVVAFPLIDLAIPYLIVKAKGRQWLTEDSGHLISETALLAASCTHYYLFRTYIQQPI